MKQQQSGKNASQAQPAKKDMKVSRRDYPDTTEERLNEAKAVRDNLSSKSSKDSSKSNKK